MYGGTFDPPHRAHVALPAIVAEKVGAAGVIYVPARRPPHKPADNRTPAEHRLAMLQRALAGQPHARVDTCELDRVGPSYTVDTLRDLRRRHGEAAELRLLIGADMALIFDEWREPEAIERLAEPIVMLRPPHDRDALLDALPPATRPRWATRIVPVPLIDVSSSAIRRAAAEGRLDQVAGDLPPGVADYIREHHLYADR